MSKRLCLTVVLSAVLIIAGTTAAWALHDPVPLLNDAGAPVAIDGTEAYSPKQTCGGDTVACHNYGFQEKTITHTQGVIESTNEIYWQSYDVTFFDHGVSKGRHSNQGRNEAYTTQMREAFGDPFFTSSPGMFGKY